MWNWTVCYSNSKWGTSMWLSNTQGHAHWYCAIQKYMPSSLGDVPVPFAFIIIIVITLCSAVLFIGHVRQTFARIDLPPNAPEEKWILLIEDQDFAIKLHITWKLKNIKLYKRMWKFLMQCIWNANHVKFFTCTLYNTVGIQLLR